LQQGDKHSRIYKALKINRSKTQYFREFNEYMTQQNLIDLGLSTSSKLKYVYETAHQIQEAIKKQSLCQNSFNCKIMKPPIQMTSWFHQYGLTETRTIQKEPFTTLKG
jgi:hypothetical protein